MQEGKERWSRILVGTDLSPQSELAVDYAIRLAEALHTSLDIAFVHQTVVSAVPEMVVTASDDEAALAQSRRRLAELSARIGERIPTEVHVLTTATVPGLFQSGPSVGLLKLIEELMPDFVIVGSHGHGAVMRLLLGSVAEQLCRHSPVPVIVIPDPERAAEARGARPS